MSQNATNTCAIYHQTQYVIISGLHSFFAAVSSLACLFVILLILLFRKYRFFAQRLILYLSIASLLFALADTVLKVDYVVQNSATHNFCKAIGFIHQCTQWMMLLAVCVLTFDILYRLRLDRQDKYTATTNIGFELFYLILIFISPFFLNWIPFVFDAYGMAGDWCWINNTIWPNCTLWTTGVVLQFSLWWVPLMILMTIIILAYIIIIGLLHFEKNLKAPFNPEQQVIRKNVRKEIRSIFWFPIIFLLFSIISLANRIQGAFSSTPILALWSIHAVVGPLQGGFIALAYFLDPGTRKRLNFAHLRAACRDLLKKNNKRISDYNVIAPSEREKTHYGAVP